MNRREFIGKSACALAGAAASGCAVSKIVATGPKAEFIWGELIHLGMNMWWESPNDWKGWPNVESEEVRQAVLSQYVQSDRVRFDEKMWFGLSDKLHTSGVNLILLDLGEAVVYPSHPELAVKGSWSVEKLRTEITRLRGMGFEVIPKINFSTSHDLWLGEYHKMVSTSTYYRVCADLIKDVCDIFDMPRFVHLGLDEEIAEFQAFNSLVVLRQGDLWWHDFRFFVDECEKNGSQAWIWSDYLLRHDVAEFRKKMPKTVIQSPWQYSGEINPEKNPSVKQYVTLAENGYDVIPCASNCYQTKDNFVDTVKFCSKALPKERLRGFLMAPWCEMTHALRHRLVESADQVANARRLVQK